jgi:hypothetical protein
LPSTGADPHVAARELDFTYVVLLIARGGEGDERLGAAQTGGRVLRFDPDRADLGSRAAGRVSGSVDPRERRPSAS